MAEVLSGLVPLDRPAPVFVSLVGDDSAGAFLAASLRRLRLDLSQLVTCPGAPTPCVSAVMDSGGEVAAAVADVASVEQLLTPERLAECRPQMQQASMLLAEANLSTESLEYVSRLAAQARVPVFLEPVSVPKAARLARSLPFATFISPNAGELLSIVDEVRRGAGLPLLPRPVMPEEPPQQAPPAAIGGATADVGCAGEAAGAGGGEGAASASGGGGGGQLEPGALVVELLRQLAAFAEVVLLQGTSYVVLTLGSLGAALISLADPDAAAAASAGPRPPLEPLDVCSISSTGDGSSGAAAAIAAGSCAGAYTGASGHPRSCLGSAGIASRHGPHCGGWFAQAPASCAAAGGLAAGGMSDRPAAPGAAATAAAAAALVRCRTSAAASGPHQLQVTAGYRSAPVQYSSLSSSPVAAAAVSPVTAVVSRHPTQQWEPQPALMPPESLAQPPPQPPRRAVEVAHLRALPAEVVSVNGAGDTLVAGMVAALLQQHPPVQALAYGMAAAKRAVESPRNSPELDFPSLRPDAERVLASLQRHIFPPAPAI